MYDSFPAFIGLRSAVSCRLLEMILRNRTRLKPLPVSRSLLKRKQKSDAPLSPTSSNPTSSYSPTSSNLEHSTSKSPNFKKASFKSPSQVHRSNSGKTIVRGKAGNILRSMTKSDLEGLVVRLSCEVKRLQKVICCHNFLIPIEL